MNLRETIRNLSKEDKQAVYATLTRNERLHAVAQNSDSTIYAYEIQPMSIIYFRDDKWANYVSFEVIGDAFLATDHATTILTRDEVLELLKVEEYTLDNLPKNGWYVELPEDKNHIDLDKLNKAWKREYEFYYKDGDTVCKYYGIKPDGRICCTNYFEYVKNLENVTHLFLKKKEEEMETIEIDGKKYRQIDTRGKFENGDIVKYKGKDHIFIGYTKDNKAVLQKGINFAARDISLIYKLEELKVLTWHYAIYKDSYGDLYKSDFYESKEELEDFFPNSLEYRTFEEQL